VAAPRIKLSLTSNRGEQSIKPVASQRRFKHRIMLDGWGPRVVIEIQDLSSGFCGYGFLK